MLGYYWGLRVLANAWARCGNYMVDSKLVPGTKTRMMGFGPALDYADRALRVTMATGMPWQSQLPWMEKKDRLTRSIMAKYIRLKHPASEALKLALTECSADWSYVRGSQVASEHQTITDLDRGAQCDERVQTTFPNQSQKPAKGAKSLGKGDKLGKRAAPAVAGKGDGKRQRTQPPAAEGKWTGRFRTSRPSDNQKICGAFNSRKGCTADAANCPQWGLHICGYMTGANTICGANDHGFAGHTS